MSSTTFTDKRTVMEAAWAQDVNDATYLKKNVSGVGRIDVYSRGILADGTDQTAAMVSLLGTLGTAGWRGVLYISYGTKFTMTTVYAAVPTGIVLVDESSVNIGHSPGGVQKVRIVFSGDTASDDFNDILASKHHPARTYMNLGGGTTSGTGRFATEQFAIGLNYENDLLTTLVRQHKKDEGSNRWMISERVQTPYSVAIKNPQEWAAGTAYSLGDYVASDSGKIYLATTGGTSGSSAPTGTGTGITDGSCVWDYKFPAINIDSTFSERWEDGDVEFYGVGSLTSDLTVGMTMGARRAYFNIALATGLQIGGMQSYPRSAVTGATPTLGGSYGYVTNASSTTMTNLSLPASQTSGVVDLMFGDANTTLQHGTNFFLKGATNANPPAGSFLVLEKFSGHSSAWFERSRSF